jgi:hypothetical protein
MEQQGISGKGRSIHRFIMTTSKYSLGTTIVSSPALFIRAISWYRSFSRRVWLSVSSAANALSIGP